LEDATSIEKAAQKLEKEEGDKAKALAKESEAAADEAVKDAKQSEDLDSKAKKEVNNTSAATKDSEQAVELAKKAVNASEKARNITEKADSIEAVALRESQQMFAVAAQLKKEAEDEAKQAVQAMDGSSLTALVAEEDVFVAFYAPWCPHCQTYVMHDEEGNAENAPIEQLNKHLKNGVKVVKFDVDAHQVPTGFDVQYIPTMYFANKDVKVKYEGDPMDFDAVEKFTSKDHKAGATAPSQPAITVIAKKHEVNIKAGMKHEVNAFEKLRNAAKLGREMKREH
jgi:thiol-disulfide isomerase/thioredoxin